MDENKETTSVVTEPKPDNKIILDGKEVTASQLAEVQAKNPRKIVFDESTKEYRTLQTLRG